MEKIWDVVVVGSGPASLTAAIYLARGGAAALVVAGEKWGGQLMLTTEVENFPGFPQGVQGPELMLQMRQQAERFGAELVEENIEKVDFRKKPFELFSSKGKYLTRSVIIATGAETQWLGVPGESQLIGRGVSSCAPCDAPFFKDKKVLVVGGGDSAMEEALILTKYASSVMIAHRRDQFRASEVMQRRVLENKEIRILWNTEVVEIIGDQKLEEVKLKNNQTGEIREEKIDGLFVAIGHLPNTKIFKGQIKLDQKGYMVVEDGTKTDLPGVFVAGDVHDYRYKQAVTAAGFGCMAALDVLKYLEENQ